MNDNQKPKYGWQGCAMMLAVPFIVAALYVLSAGPVLRLTFSGAMRWETYTTIYAPVGWVLKSGVSPLDDWLRDYLMRWATSAPTGDDGTMIILDERTDAK